MWPKLILLLWFRTAFADGDDVPKTGTPLEADNEVDKFGTSLVTQLRNDANLDLSQDEEYEDLRAELLAYHTALAKLSDTSSRRSMKSTTCWRMGGICIVRKMCMAARQVFQANACRDKREVCCFAWNRAIVREDKALGFRAPYPWFGHNVIPFEGGVVSIEDDKTKKKKKKKKKKKIQEIVNAKDDREPVDSIETKKKKTKVDDSEDRVDSIEKEKRKIKEDDAEDDGDSVRHGSNTETLALILKSI